MSHVLVSVTQACDYNQLCHFLKLQPALTCQCRVLCQFFIGDTSEATLFLGFV